MAHIIREHDPEAAMRAYNNEYHDSDQLDAFHPNNLFEPLEPLRSVQLQSTDASITTSNAHLPQWQIPAVIAVVCAGGLVTALDAVVVAAILPSIAKDLSATSSELAWIGASYLLGSALLQPVWPGLSNLIGCKWTLALGFILSILGSLIAVLANQANVIIVGRAFQGLGAGNLSLMCIKMLYDLFSHDEHSRFKYSLIHYNVSCFGLALGPVLGGWLSSSITWRWCFHLNLLISGLAVTVLFILVDIPRSPQKADAPDSEAIEWLRPALIITTTILLLVGLQLVGPCLSRDSAAALGIMAVGITVGVVCIVQQGPDRQSPLNSDDRSPAACLAVSFLHGFTYIGCLYYLPIYFQLVLGAIPVRPGLWFFIPIVLMLLMRGVAATVSGWTDCDPPIVWTGASILTLGIGVSIAFPPHRNLPLLVFVLLLVAIGTGLLFEAPLYALYSHSPRKDRSRARAACIFRRTLGSGIGIVVGQVVLQNELITRLASSADISQDPATVLADMSSLPFEMREVLRAVLTASLSRVWILFTATAGLCLLTSLLIRPKTPVAESCRLLWIKTQHSWAMLAVQFNRDTANSRAVQTMTR